MNKFLKYGLVAIAVVAGLVIVGSLAQPKTPKDIVHEMTYTSLAEGELKVSSEKARCISDKVVAKLANDVIENFAKMKELKDNGLEGEIAITPKFVFSATIYAQAVQEAMYECQQ